MPTPHLPLPGSLGRVRYARTLTPADVGARVVVRRRLSGSASADVLGELVSWSAGLLVVRRRDGTEVTIKETAMVAAKRVPPAPEPPR